MLRARIAVIFSAVVVVVLVAAPSALANSGQGWYGESDDKSVTNVMFATIAFFPVLITVFSLIQWRLDKRKHAKVAAQKRRAANSDWLGGW